MTLYADPDYEGEHSRENNKDETEKRQLVQEDTIKATKKQKKNNGSAFNVPSETAENGRVSRMRDYIAFFSATQEKIDNDAELQDKFSSAFIEEIEAALQLVTGIHAEVELFIANPDKTPEDMKAKEAVMKEARTKVTPLKLKILRAFKKFGKNLEGAVLENDE